MEFQNIYIQLLVFPFSLLLLWECCYWGCMWVPVSLWCLGPRCGATSVLPGSWCFGPHVLVARPPRGGPCGLRPQEQSCPGPNTAAACTPGLCSLACFLWMATERHSQWFKGWHWVGRSGYEPACSHIVRECLMCSQNMENKFSAHS